MRWTIPLLLVLASFASGAECGADGEPRCEFAPATKMGASGCTPPKFLDIGKNQCWQCPDGYERSLEAVDGPNACKRPVAAQRFAATRYGASGCQSGEFLDLTLNQCWQCPTSYGRTLSAVTASDACAATIPSQLLSATNNGPVPGCAEGQFTDLTIPGCWSCPSGYVRTIAAVTASNACQTGGIFGPVSSATNNGIPGCPAGQFTDLTVPGCWSCPSGSNRTVFAVNSASACEVPARTVTSVATYKRPNPCPAGQFQDPVDGGTCWSCPNGTVRTIFPVNGNTACEIPATSVNSAASFRHTFPCPSGQIYDALADGGSCWTCPANHNRSLWPVNSDLACTIAAGLACDEGLIDIGGKCLRSGVCGGANQRPCTVLERIPSCDPGFYEEFSVKKCLPILPGESPFLKGLNSLAGTIFDVQAICEDVAGLFPKVKTGDTKFDGSVACGKGFAIGFSCAIPTLALDLSKVSAAADAIGNYYESAPCNVPYSEELQPATRHGASRLLTCPEGQFFDLIDTGTCWSCPAGWQRTLYPVNSVKACSRGEGVPQLFRGLCAVGQVVTGKPLGNPIACMDAMFKDGLPLEEGSASSVKATEQLCNLAGEFTFEFVAKSFMPLAVVEDPVVRRARLVSELEKIQEGLSTTVLVDKISKEPACMGFLTPAGDSIPTSARDSERRRLMVSPLPNGGLRIDLPSEVGSHGVLRRMDGTQVMLVRSPGISVASGTLRSGVYLLTITGGSANGPMTIPVTIP